MTIHDYIAEFLKDAQYRVGKLTAEIDALSDDGGYLYDTKKEHRLWLTTFMDILYEGRWLILDGYNHVQYVDTPTEDFWTEREIIQEIQYLRYHTNMNEVPYINFTGHYPQIVSTITGSSQSGSGFPAGLPGDMLFYNLSGGVYADSVDSTGGMYENETIDSYFTGRT